MSGDWKQIQEDKARFISTLSYFIFPNWDSHYRSPTIEYMNVQNTEQQGLGAHSSVVMCCAQGCAAQWDDPNFPLANLVQRAN